ncbi:MAG: S41 family peptidase [Clostridia bacterium]|nr:S41 family peptidase [Clostridia bacterium]
MENEKKDIDVFQDGDKVEQKEIFVDYSNQETKLDAKMVSRKTAIISIIATFLVLIIIGGAFAAGFFTARNTGIEGDMPMLQSAYEYIKKYYYEDITWSEFQELVTMNMVNLVDSYTFMTANNSSSGGVILGFNSTVNKYNSHFVTSITPGSPTDLAVAQKKCSDPHYSASGNYESVEYSTQEDCSNVKIEVGDVLYAVSFMGLKPIVVDGLSRSDLQTILNSSETFDLYFLKSDGEGNFDEENEVYKYHVQKKYVQTKYAFLYTPEQIGDPTGQTAMIRFTSFAGTAIYDFAQCAQAFVEAGYKNLILDLRNNGGGEGTILDFIGGCLIKGADTESKKIIYYVKNTGNGKYMGGYEETVASGTIATTDGNITVQAINLPSVVEGFKLTVLCNGSTASSSEALIGALMYYNDTKIIGATTYGKGVGQVTIPFANGKYYLTITNGKYYVPTDEDGDGVTEWTKSIHEVGFTPDDENITDRILRPMRTDKDIARALTLFSE